jgi:sec-independent protein translocase protein TatC
MPLTDHLAELRTRLGRSVLALSGGWALAFAIHRSLVEILLRPAGNIQFIYTAPAEYFVATLKVTLLAGMAFAYPLLVREFAAFVGPGLLPSERRSLWPFLVAAALLFGAGLFFAYALLLPAGLHFLRGFSPAAVQPMWSIGTYLGFVASFCLAVGIAFQLPLVLVGLAMTRLVTGEKLIAIRRSAWMIALTTGALASPSADLLSQALLGMALGLLYEASIIVIRALIR